MEPVYLDAVNNVGIGQNPMTIVLSILVIFVLLCIIIGIIRKYIKKD